MDEELNIQFSQAELAKIGEVLLRGLASSEDGNSILRRILDRDKIDSDRSACLEKAKEIVSRSNPIVFFDHFCGITLRDYQEEIVRAFKVHQSVSILLPPEFGATTILRGLAEWSHLRNPDLRILWVSATDAQAAFTREKTGIDWSRDSKFIGSFGSLGDSKFDLIILDAPEWGLKVDESGATAFWEWCKEVAFPRLCRDGRIIHIGNNMGELDFHHHARNNRWFFTKRIPASLDHEFLNVWEKSAELGRETFERLYLLKE